MAANRAAGRLRRTWPQRLLIAFNVVCIIAALATAGSLTYIKQTVGEIPRVRLGGVLQSSGGGTAVGRPQNYLIVGVDSAAGLAPGDPVLKDRGSVAGLRSDTIMVLRIDPRSTKASLVSFPRDLWVHIAGTNHKRKINSAIELPDPREGVQRLILTISQDFQIPIDHYLQVDFAGFKDIVRVVGGIPIYFPEPAQDKHSGLYVLKAGCKVLDQGQALAYVRSRYYERLIDGQWQSDVSSDLGRISRQQDFIRRVIRRAIAKGVRNPVKLVDMLNVGVRSVTLDETLSLRQLQDLGLRFRSFNPDNLKTYGLPVVLSHHNGADTVDLIDAEAVPIIRTFQGVDANALAPGTVKVKVLNGSGRTDQATTVTADLGRAGFQIDTPDDAPAVAQTVVYYGPGRQGPAQLVARYLAAPVRLEESVFAGDVSLITGPDFTGVLATPKPANAVPTTTTTPPPPAFGSDGRVTPPSGTPTTVQGVVPPPPPRNVNCG